MASNKSLHAAKKTKKDEFYTRREDIENELSHYADHFRDKVVYCNCDDPVTSEFWQFFMRNFRPWGLKKLIATHYEPDEKNYAYMLEISEDTNGDGVVDWRDEPTITQIPCNGDFRSAACIELLKQADIVVTNPPFSLVREYIQQLIAYNKEFVIIGPLSVITYKETFPLLRDNKMWVGYGFSGGNAYFHIPHGCAENYADGVYNSETGLVHFRNCTWFTNIDIKKRHIPLDLRGNYYSGNENTYPRYENFDGIDVGRLSDIPCDYFGYIGVPQTYASVHCPDQFEIIGVGSGYLGQSIGIGGIAKEHKAMMRGHSAAGDLYYMKDGKPKVPYARLVIRRKEQPHED